jgi:tRNA A37 N6-isopentenylltransferase MiaA
MKEIDLLKIVSEELSFFGFSKEITKDNLKDILHAAIYERWDQGWEAGWQDCIMALKNEHNNYYRRKSMQQTKLDELLEYL